MNAPKPAIQVPILRVPFDQEDRDFIFEGINDVLGSGQLTQGKYVARFEELFAASIGARYAVAVNSATAALEVILRGLGIQGASVIVPTNTFLATALAVIHSGNRVIFADSDPETLCLDPEDVARRIEEDTRAVILVHIGGIVTPGMAALRALCESRSLELIEDCAHAHGCSIDGAAAGTLGVAGAFSFFPTKVLTSGEGGLITTNDRDLYEAASMLRNQGKNPQLGNRISDPGHNFRMSEITGVVAVQQTRKAEALYAERRSIARYYDDALGGVAGLSPAKLAPGAESGYYKYVVHLDPEIDRAGLKATMRGEFEVSLTGEVYAELCHDEPIWDSYDYWGTRREPRGDGTRQRGPFPGAERISRHHICLPVYPGLSRDEREHVVASLKAALARG